MRPTDGQLANLLSENIRTSTENHLPLSYFAEYSGKEGPACITADKHGRYYALELETGIRNLRSEKQEIRKWAKRHKLAVQFTGRHTEAGENMRVLVKIFFLALVLLYFILALQFDHLLLPLVVMSALIFGAAGGIWLLYLIGSTFNIMAGIGFVIVLGIIIDDPILKVEVILQEWERLQKAGYTAADSLNPAVDASAAICLKPMLMTTLTTVFALVPVFFTSGIGAELQRPLAIVVVGGLLVGTFFTTWCTPLLFIAVMKKSLRRGA